MEKSLNIVLLDEMNLAHVEHYFAEFLSKLEARRISDSQFVEISIGAGIEPYYLKSPRLAVRRILYDKLSRSHCGIGGGRRQRY